jgi:hypothetical protein
LALAHPEHDYALGLYGINRGVISFPEDVDDDLMDSLRERLNTSIKPLSDVNDFKDNLIHHVVLLASIIMEVAKVSATVSSSFQYAVHAYGAEEPFISEVQQPLDEEDSA